MRLIKMIIEKLYNALFGEKIKIGAFVRLLCIMCLSIGDLLVFVILNFEFGLQFFRGVCSTCFIMKIMIIDIHDD